MLTFHPYCHWLIVALDYLLSFIVAAVASQCTAQWSCWQWQLLHSSSPSLVCEAVAVTACHAVEAPRCQCCAMAAVSARFTLAVVPFWKSHISPFSFSPAICVRPLSLPQDCIAVLDVSAVTASCFFIVHHSRRRCHHLLYHAASWHSLRCCFLRCFLPLLLAAASCHCFLPLLLAAALPLLLAAASCHCLPVIGIAIWLLRNADVCWYIMSIDVDSIAPLGLWCKSFYTIISPILPESST